ncbi:TPA: Dot/Icm T4SS effector Ceg3 [Legionella pneumophila]|uniref:Uncharacterized protein n=1 Tax=Legionella pneumophila TaxID=446 RepID=A0A2S6F9C1_LEGPN|nr:Dot/Icm T4SS effector Ceg3 [Legionella pneumophila]APF01917.1 hypothetical protein BIZ52_00430 [Legionella pneumophila subsp. fraseri]APF04927.1 hypothetical protein BIZ51_00430 [Legionella pneumophila subsp. fraseri]AUB67398.1 hypothetical protein BJK09_00435 [Legionella pneumophila]AUB70371.1 hypothetical protein BJK08_00435 [Legionella pneumophila]KXB25086.1 hypothetical protein PtVF66_09785 [Legionella pneumophila]
MNRLKFFSKFHNALLKFESSISNLGDPLVGFKIKELQTKKILVRADGRSLDHLHKLGGLPQRVESEKLEKVRVTDVERYQKFNLNPFGWGACASTEDLRKFLETYPELTKQAWVHKFYGSSTSLLTLKSEVGIGCGEHDGEKEELVVDSVSFEQIIASTCPKYREKYLDGGVVPNAMKDFNPKVPETMKLGDFSSEKSTLEWLLINDCEEEFAKLCKEVYGDTPLKILLMRFEGDKYLADAVTYYAKESSSSPRV